ncbi:hypothetical protein BHG40_12695 [Aeromonas salmonicida subsp. masoucida]|uniref:hypothetical protein n=1 Tax=Aeromonas salmonicida TaxID=645 RepID=UPI000BBFBB3E|nr:hypothetical protein BHG40_12695 [Aeromonas salmonicida subsp. masoucida]
MLADLGNNAIGNGKLQFQCGFFHDRREIILVDGDGLTFLDRRFFSTPLHISDDHHGQRKLYFRLLTTRCRYIFDIDTFFGRNSGTINSFSHALNTKLRVNKDPKAYSQRPYQQL